MLTKGKKGNWEFLLRSLFFVVDVMSALLRWGNMRVKRGKAHPRLHRHGRFLSSGFEGGRGRKSHLGLKRFSTCLKFMVA